MVDVALNSSQQTKTFEDNLYRRESFLVFGAPKIGEEEINEVTESLRSGWIGTGPKVSQFEKAFADYTGSSHAIAVSSCTAALKLSLIAAGIGPGDEVITTPMTFCASINAIIHTGATPVLADINPQTWNICPDAINSKLSKRTRAILPVHFAGRPCDMDEIQNIAHQNNLRVIEDCAHSIEALHRDQATGTIGDFGCFSFYATKNMTTGEGGMVLTQSAEAADKIRRLSQHGLSAEAWSRYTNTEFKHYSVVELGFKANMTDLQAGLGIHQLAKLPRHWDIRSKIVRAYEAGLCDLPISLPCLVEPHQRHALHLYPILIDEDANIDRDAFIQLLRSCNIGCGVHYQALTEHPYYRERYGWQTTDCPIALDVGRRTVSLPLSAGMTPEDTLDVINAVRSIFDHR